AWFRSMDAPYNLFPSLHIAYRTVLAELYARHSRGPLWLASAVWFSLIGFSTVFTHQHHLVDIAGGFALAGVSFYLIREDPLRRPVVPNRRVGSYFAAAAFAVLTLAVAVWPWGAFLLPWTVGLTLLVAGYFAFGGGVYRKRDGRLPRSTWFVLTPVLLGHRLSLRHYARQCRPWDEAAPGVWIGRQLSNSETAVAVKAGVTAVLDLTAEFNEAGPFRAVWYRNLPILDLTAPTREHLAEAVAFITEGTRRGVVYVHCKAGYSRSAAVVASYLLASGRAATAETAFAHLRAVRPAIVIRPEARRAVEAYARQLGGGR
ncbi:MAG TPA: dual specificity protein phosphatase family protein, partial [Gemmataceae bacterium]|nr:dual specificity protein phosphatase family protein [Gemmataceae bacterium]